MEYILGIELRTRREALGMAVDELAREARVAARHIAALEESSYHVFPAKVYAAGALRRISDVFARDDAQVLMEALNREWPHETGYYAAVVSAPKRHPRAGIFLTPRYLGAFALSALALFLIGFWGLRLFVFALPPALDVESPAGYSGVSAPTVTIKGKTEKESRLTVNGREITVDDGGNFNEAIELQVGVNRLVVISESRFGKMSEEVRYVFME